VEESEEKKEKEKEKNTGKKSMLLLEKCQK
jgi:hypothetical protein